MSEIIIKQKNDCRWDAVSLGEIMIRLDPGDQRVKNTRNFRVWEGGGEYNVTRGLHKCFDKEPSCCVVWRSRRNGAAITCSNMRACRSPSNDGSAG